MIVLDVSSSTQFGSDALLNSELNRHMAVILAYASLFTQDAVGCLIFDEKIIEYIPPRSSHNHVTSLVYSLLQALPAPQKKTNFDEPLNTLLSLKESSLVIIFISDFIGFSNISLLKTLAHRHELYAVQVTDKREYSLPDYMPFALEDSEVNQIWGKDALLSVKEINHILRERYQEQKTFFKQCGIRSLEIINQENFIKDIVKFFGTLP
jgi:uncharacterized protein (DUF58 family)